MKTKIKRTSSVMKYFIIFTLIIILGSCSKDTPSEPEPEELTLIGVWDLDQHIWSNDVVSDSPCVDLLLHLELITIKLYDWDSFSLKLVGEGPEVSSYAYSYPTPYGPVQHVYGGFDWDTPQVDTLNIDDGYTNPRFKYFLGLVGERVILLQREFPVC